MLLYIHVPFCASRCAYCSFYSTVLAPGGQGAEALRGYLDGLFRELDFWSERLERPKVETVFFGGGTPSLLPDKAVALIMRRVRKAFHLAESAEITLEGNPDSLLTPGYLEGIFKAGVNRLSMGVQSLDDELLRLLGRRHTAREAMAAYEQARICGFANINLDLIWGLPGQRLRLWLEDLRHVVELKPEHLSCYGLTLEDDAPLREVCAKGALELPPEKDLSGMYAYGAELLESHGYLHYEISNFARMGYTCRHNLGYWEGADYLGVGPAASSTISSTRWSNPADLEAWALETREGGLGKNAELLDHRTKVLELIMLRLRTARGLRFKAYKDLTGRDFMQDNRQLIRALHQKGFLRIRNGYLSLTNAGMLVSNSILEHLFAAVGEQLKKGLPAESAKSLE